MFLCCPVSSALCCHIRDKPACRAHTTVLNHRVPIAGRQEKLKECVFYLCCIYFSALQRSGVAPTIYLFVVDTCQDEDNLQALKVISLSLSLSLSLSPSHSLTHTYYSLSLSVGVSPAISQSYSSDSFSWPHHLWKDGSAP